MMKKRTRKSVIYRVRRFFDQLEWRDIVKVMKLMYGDIAALIALLLLFGFIFLMPHFFH